MPVATNLIRVTRPSPTVSEFTIVAYYHEASAVGAPNGKYHCYEFDIDGQEINHFEMNLADSVNGSPTIVWSDTRLTQQVIYDGSPAILFYEHSRGSVWLWRPRTQDISSYVYYNLAPQVNDPIMVNGSIYMWRSNPPGTIELLQFDQSLSIISIVSSIATSASSEKELVTLQSYCIKNPSTFDSFVKMPLDGSTPSVVTLANSLNPLSCSPYDANRCIVPERFETRFHRIVSDNSALVSYLWPDSAPWNKISGNIGARSHYAQGYALGFEGRVILAPEDASTEDDIILNYTLPQRNGVFPITAGIGSIP